ncbi:MAG: hypothetical protein HYT64_02085 [Candidatus Yanofskybacteria bacterium]|nr:hypothetical protein [Candidatus Yanofskybacteria bacterium]
MDREKVLKVIRIYREHFKKSGIPKKDFPHDQLTNGNESVLAHCHGMLDEMEKFVAEGRMDKVFRWLGFVQGCLWSTGCYDLESLKNHNRPDSNNEEHIERGRE